VTTRHRRAERCLRRSDREDVSELARGRWRWRGSEEVGNLTEVGAGLRSGSQVRSDRYPEAKRDHAAVFSDAVSDGGASAGGEGFGPTTGIGRPRRGERSGEHRLGGALNGGPSSTDAQSEQRSEVAGPSLWEDAPSDLTRTERAALAVSRIPPVGGPSRSLDRTASAERHEVMLGERSRGAREGRRERRSVNGRSRRRRSPAGTTADTELARWRSTSVETAREQRASKGVPPG
jgi:hypothetical protein